MSEQAEELQFDIDGSSLEGGNVLLVVGQEEGSDPTYYEVHVVSGATEYDPPFVMLNCAGSPLAAERTSAQRLLGQAWVALLGTCEGYSTDLSGNDRPSDGLDMAIRPGLRLCFGALTGSERFVTEPLTDAALFLRDYRPSDQ